MRENGRHRLAPEPDTHARVAPNHLKARERRIWLLYLAGLEVEAIARATGYSGRSSIYVVMQRTMDRFGARNHRHMLAKLIAQEHFSAAEIMLAADPDAREFQPKRLDVSAVRPSALPR